MLAESLNLMKEVNVPVALPLVSQLSIMQKTQVEEPEVEMQCEKVIQKK